MSITVSRAAQLQPTPPAAEFIAAFAAHRLEGVTGPSAHLERIAAVDNLLALVVETAARTEQQGVGGELDVHRADAAMRSALYLMGEAVKQSADSAEALETLRLGVAMLDGGHR